MLYPIPILKYGECVQHPMVLLVLHGIELIIILIVQSYQEQIDFVFLDVTLDTIEMVAHV